MSLDVAAGLIEIGYPSALVMRRLTATQRRRLRLAIGVPKMRPGRRAHVSPDRRAEGVALRRQGLLCKEIAARLGGSDAFWSRVFVSEGLRRNVVRQLMEVRNAD